MAWLGRSGIETARPAVLISAPLGTQGHDAVTADTTRGDGRDMIAPNYQRVPDRAFQSGAVIGSCHAVTKPGNMVERGLDNMRRNTPEKAMPRLDKTGSLSRRGAGKRNEHQPHAQGPRRSPMHC